jgi:Ca-activated chloride channel family protein
LPLAERQLLWVERLARGSSPSYGLEVYHYAVSHCEASDWRERSLLLVSLLNHLSAIKDQVELWRSLLEISPSAADAVFRLMLLRVQSSADLRSLHDALGFERIEPELLAALLKKAKSPSERLALLRGAAERFPDDTELGLTVLDAYEDAADDAGGRAWARKLRRRADATSHLRTSVGEYYFRLAARARGQGAKRDAEEARRTFGEIVEFAPEDPLARRRLGDLLRAHGLYAEALRQYQTLAELTPDDPSVPLLLAAAAEGTGKTEEAVRFLEKAASSAAPDAESTLSVAARALGGAFLAWARNTSTNADQKRRLRVRAARLAPSSGGNEARVIVTWSHPELRAALWTESLGTLMPAPNNFPLFGVAEAFVAPKSLVEIRTDPEDAARAARLDAKAIVTVIVDEGETNERILREEVSFRGAGPGTPERIRLRLNEAGLTREVL